MRKLQRGERLLAEQPLFRIKELQYNEAQKGGIDAAEQFLLQRLSEIDDERQKAFWALADCFHAEGSGIKTAVAIFETNAISTGVTDTNPEASRGMYAVGARFNHSCCHNVSRVWLPEMNVEVFHTTREVQAGEELFIQYCDPKATFAERQKSLQAAFRFVCDCKLCQLDPSERFASDGRRKVYRLLDASIPGMAATPQAGVEQAEKMMEIIALEFGGEPVLEQPVCYYAFQYALLCGDMALAKTWMARAYEAKVHAEGEHAGVAEWRSLARDPTQHRLAKQASVARSGKKVKPNEVCPCGSGKKYKKCCGVGR